jgi:hypothetical protein
MRGDAQKGFVVAEAMVLAAPDNDGAAATAAIAALAGDTSEEGLLNNAAAHRIFKGILHRSAVFCAALLPRLAGRLAALSAFNRASFVLVALWEGGGAAVQAAMRAELQPRVKALVAAADRPGSVLLAKLVRGDAVVASDTKTAAGKTAGKRAAATDADAEPPAAKKAAVPAAPKTPAKAAGSMAAAAAATPAAPAAAVKTPAKTPAPVAAKTPAPASAAKAAKTPAGKTPARK